MEQNGRSSVYKFSNNHLRRFIYLVNVYIEIIVDDISRCGNTNRRQHQQIKKCFRKLNVFIAGMRTQVNERQNEISEKNLRKCNKKKIGPSDQSEKSGKHLHEKNCKMNNQVEGILLFNVHLLLSFKTFSITSLTHPHPPAKGEI